MLAGETGKEAQRGTHWPHFAQEFTDFSTGSLLFRGPRCLPPARVWVTLQQRFFSGSSSPTEERLAVSGDTFDSHNRAEGAVGSRGVEASAQDSSSTRNRLTPNVTMAMGRGPASEGG